ncbi:unnamed protein product [Discosporangium mesarthrocarpum]
MDEVFLWLQRTMLGFVDEQEESFVDLGRKLLTVHKYVVSNATTEAELSRMFWSEAAELSIHHLGGKVPQGVKPSPSGGGVGGEEGEGSWREQGVGGGFERMEDSVLLTLPGFRFKDRSSFLAFVDEKLATPLRLLSQLGMNGQALYAETYAGEELKFPVILLFPFLKAFEAPEGGYKFINGRGEEQDADEFIRREEEKGVGNEGAGE